MKTQEGFVLPAVIFTLAIMGLLAVASLRTANDEHRSSRALRESGAALYAAEAGLNKVWGLWDDAVAAGVALGDSLPPVLDTLSNGATYRAVIQRVGQVRYAVRVEGRGAGASGGQRSPTVVVGRDPRFKWAIFAKDGLELNGGIIDGDIATNGDIMFSGGGATVIGDATAGGTINDPTLVGGDAYWDQQPVTVEPVDCPVQAWGPPPNGTGFSFDPTTGDLQISGSSNVTFPTGTYLFRDIKITGGAQLEVPLGDIAELYITRDLKMGGNGFINPNNTSTSLEVWGCGTDTTPWAIGGGTDVNMTLYAPYHDLALSGNGNRVGAFVGATVKKSGSGSVTYDLTLLDAEDGPPVRMIGSWTQLLN
ncbi:MAG: hypothetical protein IID05_11260 [Gemmatimonadetes bacterium]|nr:hypothetical protein [Gemmatimonadota bacterium]